MIKNILSFDSLKKSFNNFFYLQIFFLIFFQRSENLISINSDETHTFKVSTIYQNSKLSFLMNINVKESLNFLKNLFKIWIIKKYPCWIQIHFFGSINPGSWIYIRKKWFQSTDCIMNKI